MADIKFEIHEEIGILSDSSKGWTKELNIISWNGNTPKFDLRDWSPNHEKMGKGITLTNEELKSLKNLLNEMNL
ncbi:YdbC family protein [Romboutsia lituseburensis]|uniref:YdbC family protein n=1 Tax=Romboutsia lituseburensis TaxID=1537 RepID=UPI00215B08D8|nr:YdbC family protein [Romboutsia lituseburensis]MCR8743818.1 YdbC family protein [Romboutsia lituseburensis]